MTEPSIDIRSNGGATFAGPEAVDVFRAITLKSALGLLQKGISPTRGFTMTRALVMVTSYTGNVYKRTEAARAVADLEVWIATMRAAIPTTVDGKPVP